MYFAVHVVYKWMFSVNVPEHSDVIDHTENKNSVKAQNFIGFFVGRQVWDRVSGSLGSLLLTLLSLLPKICGCTSQAWLCLAHSDRKWSVCICWFWNSHQHIIHSNFFSMSLFLIIYYIVWCLLALFLLKQYCDLLECIFLLWKWIDTLHFLMINFWYTEEEIA